MSASEKLRELDGAMTAGSWGTYVPIKTDRGTFESEVPTDHWAYYLSAEDEAGVAALRNVLPLIADLAEAAERTIHANDPAATIYLHGKSLMPALTALRDALEEK